MIHLLRQEFPGISNVLFARAAIGAAIGPNEPAPATTVEYDAIWDTGASGTAITKKVADALGLKPIGAARCYNAQGSTVANVYLISLRLPGSVGFKSLRVTEQILTGFEVLIGMDVINNGDFLVTNHGGKTQLTFQCPSQGLDGLKKGLSKLTGPGIPVVPGKGVGTLPTPAVPPPPKEFAGTPRNALCPCGSNKKYKKCHGA